MSRIIYRICDKADEENSRPSRRIARERAMIEEKRNVQPKSAEESANSGLRR
jgi:hypothetical protein